MEALEENNFCLHLFKQWDVIQDKVKGFYPLIEKKCPWI